MSPSESFQYCPRCARDLGGPPGSAALQCSHCGFVFHFNPAVAAAALVRGVDGRVLFIRRAKEPARGKLGFPGGFVDAGETLETALTREAKEEVGLEIDGLEFLCSQPNLYVYRGLSYPVVDVYFLARAARAELARPLDGVERCEWLQPAEVDPGELAFRSTLAAWEVFLARRGG